MTLMLKKIALYENRATKTAIERYRFMRADGKTAEIDIAPSLAVDGKSLRARLLDGVTDSASDLDALAEAIAAATRESPPKHFVYETRTGWIRNGDAFVLQDRLVGSSPDKIIGVAPVANVNRGKARRRGTSKKWTGSVGRLAKKSTVMMLATATALSAPLLTLTNTDTFGICLFGRTRGGKTMATLSAGSVLGFGKEEQMLNWYSTTAGLEPHFPGFNDCIFPIDDLSKLPVRSEHERYLEVRKLAYQAIGGDIKGRHPTFDNASQTNAAHYRFIVLTSFEKSIQDLAHETNQERMGGETMRLIDVPAYFDGLMHIFDRAHADAELTQVELQMLFAEVTSACAKNHGQVYRRYLGHLIALRPNIKKTTLEYQRTFIKRVAGSNDNTDVADLARKFGLIYAGGRMGIDAKVLPWKRADLFEAIKKCYDGARALLLDDELLLERGRKALRSYLMALPNLRELKGAAFTDASGFADHQETCHRCIVKTEALSGIFASRLQQRLVIAALTQEGMVTLATRKGSAQPGPQSQFMWPNGKRVRSYEIKWPRKHPKTH
jgi:putative DNA primase/helicase